MFAEEMTTILTYNSVEDCEEGFKFTVEDRNGVDSNWTISEVLREQDTEVICHAKSDVRGSNIRLFCIREW